MNKLTENITELSMYFALMLEKGKLKEDISTSVSVREQFKEKVADWAQEFENICAKDDNYADKIEIFLLHKLKVENWIEEEDAEEDLEEFGYSWPGMKRLTFLDAIYRFALENKSVYLLYPDNTEAEANNLEEISEHQKNGGQFGYEIVSNFENLPDIILKLLPKTYGSKYWVKERRIYCPDEAASVHLTHFLNDLLKNMYNSCVISGIKELSPKEMEKYKKDVLYFVELLSL